MSSTSARPVRWKTRRMWTSKATSDPLISRISTPRSRSRISTAIAAFFCPMPSKARSRSCSSAAVGRSFQIAPASPPYVVRTRSAADTTHAGTLFTYRCSAVGSTKARYTASGSATIRSGSRCPILLWSSLGIAQALSALMPWSQITPTKKANGLSLKKALAAASSVNSTSPPSALSCSVVACPKATSASAIFRFASVGSASASGT